MAPHNERSGAIQQSIPLPGVNGLNSNDLISEERPRSAGTDSTLSDYCLRWLFDPNRHDHLPIEEQLEYYKQRDLRKVKIYKLATQIWGPAKSRKRKIIAPPMEKVQNKRDVNVYTQETPPMNSALKPQKPPPRLPTEEEIAAQELEDKKSRYKSWMAERKNFRSNLENMGLTEEWIAKKPDKTEVEKRVLRRMIEERTPKVITPPPTRERVLYPILPEESPIVQRPSPLAIRIIEKFLQEKRMRLIDLFSAIDKDKSWKLSRDEFRSAIIKAGIPISDVLLEDLILALDADMNNELDYRELAKGMGLWKKEKRDFKKKLRTGGRIKSPAQLSQLAGFESPADTISVMSRGSPTKTQSTSPRHSQFRQSPVKNSPGKDSPAKGSPRESQWKGSPRESQQKGSPRKGSPSRESPRKSSPVRFSPTLESTDRDMERTPSPVGRAKSAVSNFSSTSSQRLEPPSPDLRPEQLILSSEEAMVDLRKRDREALARFSGKRNKTPKSGRGRLDKRGLSPLQNDITPIIKTGDPTIDNHSTLSSLGGETGAMVDKFRQLKFKEYNEILKLCRGNNVPLSEDLLKKVLLYPGDRPHGQIKKKIRQPGVQSDMMSQHFADPPKRPKTPIQERLKDRIKVTRSGRLVMDTRHAYPNSVKCEALPSRVTLSTGKTIIKRRVDCWMTFEEYDSLTKHLAVRYTQLHGHSDDNAFWPGHLLDKLSLHMPHREPLSNSVFTNVQKQGKKAYPESEVVRDGWDMNDQGYVQYGTLDHYKNKYIHND